MVRISSPADCAGRCGASSSAVVKLQPRDDAKAVAQRVGEHARARGGAYQRERLQIQLDASARLGPRRS